MGEGKDFDQLTFSILFLWMNAVFNELMLIAYRLRNLVSVPYTKKENQGKLPKD